MSETTILNDWQNVDEAKVGRVLIPANMLQNGMIIQFPDGRWVDIYIHSASDEERVIFETADEVGETGSTHMVPRDGGVWTYYYKGE